MEFIKKLASHTDERTIRYLLKRPLGGPRAQQLRDQLNHSSILGSQVCKEGLMISFPANNVESIAMFQVENELTLKQFNWEFKKIKEVKPPNWDYHIHIRNIEASKAEELEELKIQTKASSVSTVQVKGKNTLEIVLKYAQHSTIPEDIKKELGSYQSYSPNNLLLAANFCAAPNCYKHFKHGPRRCSTHPQLQQPLKEAQTEKVKPTDIQNDPVNHPKSFNSTNDPIIDPVIDTSNNSNSNSTSDKGKEEDNTLMSTTSPTSYADAVKQNSIQKNTTNTEAQTRGRGRNSRDKGRGRERIINESQRGRGGRNNLRGYIHISQATLQQFPSAQKKAEELIQKAKLTNTMININDQEEVLTPHFQSTQPWDDINDQSTDNHSNNDQAGTDHSEIDLSTITHSENKQTNEQSETELQSTNCSEPDQATNDQSETVHSNINQSEANLIATKQKEINTTKKVPTHTPTQSNYSLRSKQNEQ